MKRSQDSEDDKERVWNTGVQNHPLGGETREKGLGKEIIRSYNPKWKLVWN